ncbi:GH92 family glycosyl hydrolase [uncultured Alistipes sp.]|uniref:GH92 family glycosyl hydrolase n=1 Tax=uncultured Alistipes sp. TaxID=538949 RepID=UPI0026199FBB|nr:GH92 family glycosyl hydrolase [uncultured Alistipes sp.]
MKHLLIALLAACPVAMTAAQTRPATDYVDPTIGTRSMGHVFPGACVPHGAVQLSPDTEMVPHSIDGRYQPDAYRYCAGYQWDDRTIVGFSHTHLSGTGHSDLGDILLMPGVGEVRLDRGTADRPGTGYRSRFSHERERAEAGYYAVTLDDSGIRAELTATERVGVHRYTFPAGARQHVVVDLDHAIYNYEGKTRWAAVRVENDTLVTGYRITSGWARTNYTYFAMSFSRAIADYGCRDRRPLDYRGGWGKFDTSRRFPELAGRSLALWFDFGDDPAPLEVRVALSAVGTTGARANLEAEAAGRTFDELAAQARAKWDEALGAVEAEGDQGALRMLYTSLYHTMINPSVYQDVDGRYRGLDHEIHTAAPGRTNYTVFSLWDTYRALHPLFNLLWRERSRDLVASMLDHCDQSVHGILPVWSHMGNENWCMIGYHGVSVVGDALDKGIGIDPGRALEAMVRSSDCDYYDGTGVYKELGYVPVDVRSTGSSMTLEYAYDDWVVYRTALRMGRDDVAREYRRRALNYRNVFDPATGFARGRMKDGGWKPDFNRYDTHGQGFIEGNSWNYSMYVPHDPDGLIALMGGDRRFTARLDSLFTEFLPDEYFAETEDVTREGLLGMYVHGNEPSHHVPYLYMWTSQPWKTQYWLREIMDRMYRPEVDGLCGNDDCGQMSAWYIFTAMGFYPVCPGSDQYVLGAPYLPRMKVRLGEGAWLEIRAPGVSSKNRYVHGVRLNGRPWTKAYLTYDDLRQGGVLEFDMRPTPDRRRRFRGEERPYSLSAEL